MWNIQNKRVKSIIAFVCTIIIIWLLQFLNFTQPTLAQSDRTWGSGPIYYVIISNGAPAGCFGTYDGELFLGYQFLVSDTNNLSCNTIALELMAEKINSNHIRFKQLTDSQIKQFKLLSNPVIRFR